MMRKWEEYRHRREQLKAELQARHDEALDEYLSADPLKKPPSQTPPGYEHFENYIPIAIRRAALVANHKARTVQKTRKHRATGRSRGPKVDDSALARHVHRLMQDYLLERIDAERELAAVLAYAENIELKTARARIRRAMRKLG